MLAARSSERERWQVLWQSYVLAARPSRQGKLEVLEGGCAAGRAGNAGERGSVAIALGGGGGGGAV